MSKPSRAPRRPGKPADTIAAGTLVFLRLPRLEDRAEMLRVRRGSRAFLEPWEATPERGPSPWGPGWFDRFLASSATDASLRMLICAADDGRIVGQIGLGGIVRGAFQSAFLGYWIAETETRRGYARQAITLAISHAFGTMGLHRVEANIIPRNKPSKLLVKRIGFRYEGLARRYLRINHVWEDHEHWAISREEWGTP
jgi:ribosomal-protein-alanine N-acetyltransferase